MEFYALECNQFLNFITMNQLFAGCLSHFLYIGLHCVYGLLGHFENVPKILKEENNYKERYV
ncbi:hypothetical protein RJ43_12365 [Alteromonas macleodii]|nr:hypothetical protein RJ43_12365 [Alteromonas macleodii]